MVLSIQGASRLQIAASRHETPFFKTVYSSTGTLHIKMSKYITQTIVKKLDMSRRRKYDDFALSGNPANFSRVAGIS